MAAKKHAIPDSANETSNLDGEAPDGPESPGAAVVQAIDRGDPVRVAQLLDAGADPDGQTDREEPLLHHAVRRGNPEVVRALLVRGVDPDAVSGGVTALFLAIEGNHDAVLEQLLLAGADPNRRATHSLAEALSIQGPELSRPRLRLLLRHGLDPNVEVFGEPFLYDLLARKRVGCVLLLLEHGAAIDDQRVVAALPGICSLECRALLATLLEHGLDPDVDLLGVPLVARFVEDGDPEGVRLMLDAGASPRARAYGRTLRQLGERLRGSRREDVLAVLDEPRAEPPPRRRRAWRLPPRVR